MVGFPRLHRRSTDVPLQLTSADSRVRSADPDLGALNTEVVAVAAHVRGMRDAINALDAADLAGRLLPEIRGEVDAALERSAASGTPGDLRRASDLLIGIERRLRRFAEAVAPPALVPDEAAASGPD